MKLDVQIWDAADSRDRATWIERWQQWPGREVFGHPDYVRLYAGPRVRALCVAATIGGSYILYPFLLRTLDAEPYCAGSLKDCTDITTPYGYGGAFWWGDAWAPEAVDSFWLEFDAWAAKCRVVSEVVRLSLFPESLVDYPGACHVLSDNVVRVLKCESELWREFEYKVRKNVAKARANDVTVQIDEMGDRLDDFLAIYARTMDRRNAADAYYFPREYFERIHADLKGQFVYFHAVVGGAVVSTELVLVSADRVYSFLGGTDAAWFHVRPNDLLKVEIMTWAHNAGKKQFILGGGYTRGDGIYRYKLSFAPDGCVPFSIGTRVLNASAYEALIRARNTYSETQGTSWRPNPEYFPAYRG